jgi:3-methyladenine DNA glycosylase AlkD
VVEKEERRAYPLVRERDTYMNTRALYKAVVSDLQKHADKEGAEIAKRYHKYAGYQSYGMYMPVFRGVLKSHKKEIQELSCKEALAFARKFHKSRMEEEKLAGNYVLQLHNTCFTPANFDYLDETMDCANSWSMVDDLCVEGGKVIAPLLQKYPEETLKLLRKWNKSKNMWKRRASVVPFTRKIGESGKFTDEALELCENLIWDKEDLVRKAVGWCLKDTMRGDKKRVPAYVKELRKRGVSSTVTSYALRDLKGEEKAKILTVKP